VRYIAAQVGAAVKGAPLFGAAERTLDGEHRSGIGQPFDGRLGGNMFLLVSFELLPVVGKNGDSKGERNRRFRSPWFFWTTELMTASALARRLITLIYAGRNRSDMIRRELPRTSGAGWVRRPYRIILVEGSPFRGPSAIISAAVQQDLTTLRRLV